VFGSLRVKSTLACIKLRLNHVIFTITPTNEHKISTKIILQLFQHVSVPFHHLQGTYSLCKLKLKIITITIIKITKHILILYNFRALY
jgi:hypothetical protein